MGLKSPANISRWENGVLSPGAENIAMLLLMYGTTFEELYHDLMEDLKVNHPELMDKSYMLRSNSSAP